MAVLRLPTAALLALLAAPLAAHGGQYRGGWSTPTLPGPGGGPGAGPADPAPLTGARPSISDGTSWQVWWEFNKDPLVDQLTVPHEPPLTGSDDFYLGSTRRAFARDTQQVTDRDRTDRIAAALVEVLKTATQRDLVTATMVALAKVGCDAGGVAIHDLFVERLASGDQEIREAAALALGIAGQPRAITVLGDLLRDDSDGRKVSGGAVSDRSRAFAAWGLGLLAGRSRDLATKQAVHDLLLRELTADPVSRDLRVALVEALGLLGENASGAEKRLLWCTVDELWAYFDRDLGRGDQLIQAHVPIAVARLLGRGDSSVHQAAKRRLVAELTATRRRQATILQSSAMALGSLCLPAEQQPDDAEAAAVLLRSYEAATDQLTRFFAALALGRIGGDANRTALLRLFGTANRAIERPWLALSLGLLARTRTRAGGDVDTTIGQLLRDEFLDVGNQDAKSALGLALGLCGYDEGADVLLPRLSDGVTFAQLIGYSCLALALLDHRAAADPILQLIDEHRRVPFVVQQAALALGRLGDVRVVPTLQRLLEASDSTAVLASLAAALAQVGDRRSIDPLVVILRDRGRPALARAFAAAALGGIGDKDPLPWNTRIAVGMNYMATVDTLTNGATGILDIL